MLLMIKMISILLLLSTILHFTLILIALMDNDLISYIDLRYPGNCSTQFNMVKKTAGCVHPLHTRRGISMARDSATV